VVNIKNELTRTHFPPITRSVAATIRALNPSTGSALTRSTPDSGSGFGIHVPHKFCTRLHAVTLLYAGPRNPRASTMIRLTMICPLSAGVETP